MADYALVNNIYIGSITAPSYHFKNKDIVLNSASGVFSVGCIGNELPIDTFSFVVRNEVAGAVAYSPTDADVYLDTNNQIYLVADQPTWTANNYLTDVKKGTPVWWFSGGQFFMKGYIDTVVRTARYAWKITCTSGVGLLADREHPGGIYTGNVSVYDLVGDIVNGAFPMFRDSALKEIKVYGWLPYDSARNNLHRLLFSEGVAMTKRVAMTDYTIGFLSMETADVPSSRIAYGGSVDLTAAATRAEVTEHSFLKVTGTEATVLFSNVADVAVSHKRIVFSGPFYDVQATDANLTVEEWGANYAVVSGTGTLVGKPYTHVTNMIAIDETEEGEPLVTKSVTDNCLVTAVNSYNTARRVLDYYRNARRIKAKILLDGEKCGQALNITDPFGDAVTAYLEKMQVLVTSVRGAQCELVQNYFPTNGGNNFDSYVIKAGSDDAWTAPADGLIRVVIIGGGIGGTGGYDGKNANEQDYSRDESAPYAWFAAGWYFWDTAREGAEGGEAGTPGQGGKILIIDKAVKQGETLTFSFGSAGQGGSRNGGSLPTAGTDTSVISSEIDEETGQLWERSTAAGQRSELGWFNPLNSTIYGASGEAGHPGGRGGTTDTIESTGYKGGYGRQGGSVGNYAGGVGGKGFSQVYSPGISPITASGGAGGGAAWGQNGDPGGDASFEVVPDTLDILRGGYGGNGATASAPSAPTYGTGGGGGNGGGGGGNGGGNWGIYAVSIRDADDPDVLIKKIFLARPNKDDDPDRPANRKFIALGGKGSRGGHAGAGCGIILFNQQS